MINIKKLQWNNIRIGWKYGIALILSILLFLSSAGIVFKSLGEVNKALADSERAASYVEQIHGMIAAFNEMEAIANDYVAYPKPDILEHFKNKTQEFDHAFSVFQETIGMGTNHAGLNKIKSNTEIIKKVFLQEIYEAMGKNDKVLSMMKKKELNSLATVNKDSLREIQGAFLNEKEKAVNQVKQSIFTCTIVLLISILISAVLGFLIILWVDRNVRKKLDEVVKLSGQVADGNLNIRKINYNGEDEVGQLSKSFNKMVDSLYGIIQKISHASTEVNRESERLMGEANDVAQTSQQITITMQQLTVGAEQQANSSSDIAFFIGDLNNRIIKANEESGCLEISIVELSRMANKGKQLMEASIAQMEKINTIVRDSVDKVKKFDEKSQEVSHLIEIINSIAEQTNLLALNAAIEAARAGEAGKGFGVVADEIRKLADKVRSSLAGINGLIKGIKEETHTVVDALQTGYGEVEEGTNEIKETGETFAGIDNEVAKVVERVHNVSNHLTQITKSSEEASSSVQQIASVTEETAAGIEETSESVQRQHSTMQEIAENSRKLSDLAEELNAVISTFKL